MPHPLSCRLSQARGAQLLSVPGSVKDACVCMGTCTCAWLSDSSHLSGADLNRCVLEQLLPFTFSLVFQGRKFEPQQPSACCCCVCGLCFGDDPANILFPQKLDHSFKIDRHSHLLPGCKDFYISAICSAHFGNSQEGHAGWLAPGKERLQPAGSPELLAETWGSSAAA